MSAELKSVIAVLFDHELRLAAEALHALHDPKTPNEMKTELLLKATKLSYLALYAICPDTQAITIIAIQDERLTGMKFVIQDKIEKEKP